MLGNSINAKRSRTGLLLVSPWLVGFVLLKIVPIVASFVFSLTDFNMLRPQEISYIGLANYATLIQDETVWAVLLANIGLVVVSVPLQLIAAIFLATLLSSPSILAATFIAR